MKCMLNTHRQTAVRKSDILTYEKEGKQLDRPSEIYTPLIGELTKTFNRPTDGPDGHTIIRTDRQRTKTVKQSYK
jgi:hypothetical protein